jgi:hypothetical protein
MDILRLAPQLEEITTPGGRENVQTVALPRLREGLHVVWQHEARIKARLGADHELARAYDDAHLAFGALYTHWSQWAAGQEPQQDLNEVHGALQPVTDRFFAVSAAHIGPERE